MKVQSSKWQKVKKEIAERQEDVTLLYRCGHDKRMLADNKDITSWKKIKADELNISSEKIRKSVDQSIVVNKSRYFQILPKKFSQKAKDALKHHNLELYLDYETFNYRDNHKDISNLDLGETVVYLIGCGFVKDGIWSFKTYVLQSLSKEDKQKLFHFWLEDFNDKGDIQIYSWGPTEKNLFEKVTGSESLFNERNYTDLLKVFRDESVAITGLHGYSLKNFAKAMKQNDCIETIWDNSEVSSGLDAMQAGEKLYTEFDSEERARQLQSIISYNEVDCKVMWEIVSYFRQNHF